MWKLNALRLSLTHDYLRHKTRGPTSESKQLEKDLIKKIVKLKHPETARELTAKESQAMRRQIGSGYQGNVQHVHSSIDS